MRYLIWAVRACLFLLLFGFALKNTSDVTLRLFLGAEWHGPLILFLLVFFALGAIAGLSAALPAVFRQRRELDRLRRAQPGEPARVPGSAVPAPLAPPPMADAPLAPDVRLPKGAR